MIPQFTAFITLFQQGKELTHAATWKNRTIATNALVAVLGAAILIAKGFGYDIQLDDQTIQTAVAGGFAIFSAVNAVMHVITSAKVGLPAPSEPGPADAADARGIRDSKG